MHDGEDEYIIRLNGIQDSVRKHMSQAAPNICFNKAPTFRHFDDSFYRMFDRCNESLGK